MLGNIHNLYTFFCIDIPLLLPIIWLSNLAPWLHARRSRTPKPLLPRQKRLPLVTVAASGDPSKSKVRSPTEDRVSESGGLLHPAPAQSSRATWLHPVAPWSGHWMGRAFRFPSRSDSCWFHPDRTSPAGAGQDLADQKTGPASRGADVCLRLACRRIPPILRQHAVQHKWEQPRPFWWAARCSEQRCGRAEISERHVLPVQQSNASHGHQSRWPSIPFLSLLRRGEGLLFLAWPLQWLTPKVTGRSSKTRRWFKS